MSRALINEYRAELDRLRAVTGSTRETNLRPAFARLLRAWGKQDLDLVFVEEHQIRTPQGNLISVDGALLHALRVSVKSRTTSKSGERLTKKDRRSGPKVLMTI